MKTPFLKMSHRCQVADSDSKGEWECFKAEEVCVIKGDGSVGEGLKSQHEGRSPES